MDTSLSSLVLYLASVPLLAFILRDAHARLTAHTIGRKPPPGPPGAPLLGNLLQVPVIGPWKHFESLGGAYGDMVRLDMAGEEMLVINSPKQATDLLEKRSAAFSSRRPLVYAGKYQSHNKRLLLLQYGEEFKRQRAAFQEMLNPRIVKTYEPLHEQESMKLLFDILTVPPAPGRQGSSTLRRNMKRFTASLVFTLTYGKKLADDKNLDAVLKILENFLPDCAPGAHLVDTFPILDKLPDFLSPWRKVAQGKHDYEIALYKRLVNEVRADMAAGTADPCFTASLWPQHDAGKFDEETLCYVAGSAFEASIGTTSGTLMWFIMAMLCFPDVQRRAQQEIDAVLGQKGNAETADVEPPTLAHLQQLPYCVALVKEVMRWMPVAPGAFPHQSTQDEEYDGYFIPAKTLVMPNVWAMHRDPRNFVEPDRFDPERYMTGGDLTGAEAFTDGHWGFGFGRRICPARYLASKSIFIVMIRCLWAFDITHAIDEQGKELPVDPLDCAFHIVNEPNDFPLRMLPRSERHAVRIRKDWADIEHQWQLRMRQ